MSTIAATFVQRGKKIVAIGRNYAAHAKELNNPTPKEPFFFLKPTTSYVESGGRVEIPRGIIAHHEVELGLVIGKGGRNISEANATSHVAGYTLAVDMTARNLQDKVKKAGLPWSAAKGFDTFTPIGYVVCFLVFFSFLAELDCAAVHLMSLDNHKLTFLTWLDPLFPRLPSRTRTL
ncbi:hypothetical protein H0H93_003210 [Arthromyces matolae]|nr:hypothetical protein H0H93_003210 [Arthromyces matolae]